MKLIDIKQFNSGFLIEGRVDTIKQLFTNKIQQKLDNEQNNQTAEQFIDKVVSFDPTKNKQYVQWMLNQYIKGNVKSEDLYKLKPDLALFDKQKTQFPKKDINLYTVSEFTDTVENINPNKLSNKQQKQQIKLDGAEKIIEGPDCTIIKLKTKEAARFYGANTKWCTAAEEDDDNMFDHYNQTGPIFVVVCKDGRKFQIHFSTGQYMDEQDKPVELSRLMARYPSVASLLDYVEQDILKTKNSDSAYIYADDVIRGRWPEAEKFIVNEPAIAYLYAMNVIRGRWPEAEPIIMKNSWYAYEYAKAVIKGRWPEAEPYIIKTGNAILYAKDVIKGDWPEAGIYL